MKLVDALIWPMMVSTLFFLLSVRTRFSKEEQAAIQYFNKLFGTKISDYVIVV